MKHSDYYAQMIIGGGGSDSGGGGGTPGQAATIQVGQVTTGEPGTPASVTNVGTENAAIFDFVIPKGADGADGEDGAPGADGAPGQAATIQVGQVTTGEPGTDASVENIGTEQNAILKFTIPKGEKGDPGTGGGGGVLFDIVETQNITAQGNVLRLYSADTETYTESYVQSAEGLTASRHKYSSPTAEVGVRFPLTIEAIFTIEDPQGTGNTGGFPYITIPGMAEWQDNTHITFKSTGTVAFGMVNAISTRPAVAQLGIIDTVLTVTKE